MEFSNPSGYIFNKIYDYYLFNYIPKVGKIISNNLYSYQYLSKSIKNHPNQEKLKKMMERSGFFNVKYDNLTNGIAAIHCGFKCY